MSITAVVLKWFGQACFLITLSNGTSVAIDPYGPGIGYPVPVLKAQVCLVTHDHPDHNNVSAVKGDPTIIRTTGTHKAGGITFNGIAALHYGKPEDSQRGADTIFTFQADGVRFCHVGDLGRLLTPEQIKDIGRVDVLMIPVGGYFTIDAGEAWKVVDQLKPKIVIPMHYGMPGSKITTLSTVDPFIKGRKNVKHIASSSVKISRDTLPKKLEVWVLERAQ
jgi:L-ascorbate metabolism protein UlaG (beta-lactamase superfamily)